jgi:tryptophan-rich sensory protein
MLQDKSARGKLIAAILVCQGAGLLGTLFTAVGLKSWYGTLIKPSFNPPGWVFGPVWTTLFVMMGVALYLVWNRTPSGEAESRAMTWFFVQLALNVLWSFCFFTLKSPLLGFIEILFLLAAIVVTIVSFWQVSRTAGVLLLPYLAWVSFATFLTFSIWRLNG